MTVHRIRLLGDPILRTRCEPVTKPRSAAVRLVIDDLKDTLRDWQSRFGAGRGIAVELGAAGATVYVTGRTTRGQRSEMDRPETIEETAELVDRAGGRGIASLCIGGGEATALAVEVS